MVERSHAQCTHEAFPRAQRACRMVRPVLAYAERLGLVVEDVTTDPRIPQYRIRNPRRDDVWSDNLLITAGYGTPTATLSQLTKTVRVPWSAHGHLVRIWLDIINI